MRGLTKKERNNEIRQRRWKYTWYVELLLLFTRRSADEISRFGTMALLLQLVPVFSMFFLLTSACGSALWVVKLEEQKRLNEEVPRVVVDEEAPPPYTDNPI